MVVMRAAALFSTAGWHVSTGDAIELEAIQYLVGDFLRIAVALQSRNHFLRENESAAERFLRNSEFSSTIEEACAKALPFRVA